MTRGLCSFLASLLCPVYLRVALQDGVSCSCLWCLNTALRSPFQMIWIQILRAVVAVSKLDL